MPSLMSKRFGVAVAIGLGIGAATAALAHDDPRPKGQLRPGVKAAHDRHDNFQKLGAAMKRLNDELRKGDADIAVVRTQTATIASLANALPTWFPRGSGTEARAKAETKPNIWTDAAGFSAAASNMQVQTSKLNQLALAGDLNAVKGQVRATGGSCKGCHDKFRDEKK
jgi:cytochrome c556